MTNYLFAYRFPADAVPNTSDADASAAWRAWFEEIGPNVVDTGNPVFESRVVGEVPANGRLGGYTIVTADSLDEAAAFAGKNPAIANGASIEVGTITVMYPDSGSAGQPG